MNLMLQTVKEAGVKNYLVVAIDTKLQDHLMKEGFNVYFRDVKVRGACLNTQRDCHFGTFQHAAAGPGMPWILQN